MGGPEKGFRLASVGPMGELTEVASAKRAVRGVLMDRVEEPESVRARIEIVGRFLPSELADVVEELSCAPSFSASGISVLDRGDMFGLALQVKRAGRLV